MPRSLSPARSALSKNVCHPCIPYSSRAASSKAPSRSSPPSRPTALRFAAESYVHGWRAEKSDAPRQCTIDVDFRFDGSQAACSAHTEVHARSERLDDTHVLVHLNCDIW